METTTEPITNTSDSDFNSKIQSTLISWTKYIMIAVCIALAARLASILYNKKTEYDVTRRNTACPALLSISRSARDTLIIMKAEPLCNEYVLANLN